ncbi:hypothetical protein DPEC_G00266830 [Dallia pectoralis]|uniref:Uncharacterized protein n=1 Tax=Dallia pectoralis TaxID=75939 RepID=A0ACC2FNJ1_DALPE|nr:hypothetical protein DPEC_G00266830 [Dallia pectoralis]
MGSMLTSPSYIGRRLGRANEASRASYNGSGLPQRTEHRSTSVPAPRRRVKPPVGSSPPTALEPQLTSRD